MGMSFMISRNMEGDTTGSQLLGNRGSDPLSTTLRSSIQRLKDSRGGSIPEGQRAAEALDLVNRFHFGAGHPGGTTLCSKEDLVPVSSEVYFLDCISQTIF